MQHFYSQDLGYLQKSILLLSILFIGHHIISWLSLTHISTDLDLHILGFHGSLLSSVLPSPYICTFVQFESLYILICFEKSRGCCH